MTYSDFLTLLQTYKEEEFAAFQRKLIFTEQEILGVRTPVLRKLAKAYEKDFESIFEFPDQYYEVTFIKLSILAMQPYEVFLAKLDRAVSLIDNWATCDSFKGKYICKHKDEFLSELNKLFQKGGEFRQRYVLVVLLTNYVEEKYIPAIKKYLQKADKNLYYIHMAAAWLTAEVLIKNYEDGLAILREGILPKNTHNKSIQKAIESYRLNKEQKEYLRSLKIK